MEKHIKDLKKIKDKKRIADTKATLREYGECLKKIDELRLEIAIKRDSIQGVGSGLANTNTSKGGGSSQESKICKVMDDIHSREVLIKDIKGEFKDLEWAIKSLDDPRMIGIVFRIWIYGTSTMRLLGAEYGLSKSAMYKKSDLALLRIYKMIHE